MAQAPNVSAQNASRPVSPHLQIWRWHVTMLASILHRATGIALTLGAIGLAAWLAALAAGPEVFTPIDEALHSLLGQVVLYGLVAALGFHLLAGLRHLVLDAGLLFKKPSANLSAWIAVSGLVIAPVALWVTLQMLQG